MVRPAAPEDAAALADVHVTSWQATYRGVFDDDFLESLDRGTRAVWFEARIGSGASILVDPDERPKGFCWYGKPLADEEEEDWAEVYAIYVHPEAWGEGHGHRLLAAAVRDMTELGYNGVFLWVLDRNERARSFYERQGWQLAPQLKLEEIGGMQVTEVRYQLDLGERSQPG